MQNAEDSKYPKATRDEEIPYLAISLYKGRIVINSNKDGLNDYSQNLKNPMSVFDNFQF